VDTMSREEKILIVEDNPLIAAAIEKAGERYNLRAEVATDGWDAIEKLRNEEYAAIVIDADLPRYSGYGVVTYLKQENGEQLQNVLVMTTADAASVRQRTSEHLRVIDRTDAVDTIAAALGPERKRE
jgi:DNA-binding response OmpR family regulator